MRDRARLTRCEGSTSSTDPGRARVLAGRGKAGDQPGAVSDPLSAGSGAAVGLRCRIRVRIRRVGRGVEIVARGLCKAFDRGLVRALDGVDLDLAPAEMVSVTGPTGCGKTTLLNLLALLDAPDGGSLLLDGVSVERLGTGERWRAQHVGLVFQHHHLLPHLTVAENVSLPLVGSGLPRRERARRTAAVLEEVGVGHRKGALAGTLSGGERQLTAVARALVVRPALLLADEPTGSVDSVSGERVMNLIVDYGRGSGATVVVVTHDPTVARRLDRELRMRDGRTLD